MDLIVVQLMRTLTEEPVGTAHTSQVERAHFVKFPPSCSYLASSIKIFLDS